MPVTIINDRIEASDMVKEVLSMFNITKSLLCETHFIILFKIKSVLGFFLFQAKIS